MTREEQIEQAAKRYVKDIVSPLPASLTVVFIKGAMWADKHPTTELIDKACEWLKEYVCDYLDRDEEYQLPIIDVADLINDFKKDMEEQQ